MRAPDYNDLISGQVTYMAGAVVRRKRILASCVTDHILCFHTVYTLIFQIDGAGVPATALASKSQL